MKRKYDEMSVVRALSKNPDVKINSYGKNKSVEVVRGSQYCGNGTWGKIDFLVKHCGYVQVFINITEQIAAKQAEKAAKRQAARDAKNARGKVTLNGEILDVRKVMRMKL